MYVFDWFYWSLIAVVVTGALVGLAVHWRVWRHQRALRGLVVIVTGGVAGGTALVVAVNFICGWLHRVSPLTTEIVAYVLILAGIAHIVRVYLQRGKHARSL